MIVRKIKEEEIIEARNISAVSFEWEHNTEGKTISQYVENLKKDPKNKEDKYFMEKWAAFTDDGEMMSNICVLPYEINFDKNSVKMAGIGGVCTYPQHRKKGAIKQCLLKAFEEMYEKNFDFSYLYAFSEGFYGNLGYNRSTTCVEWNFDMKCLISGKYKGSFELYKSGEDISDFQNVYKRFAERLNLMVYREKFDWSILRESQPFKNSQFAFLYKDEKGIEKGYFIFKKTKEEKNVILDIKEIVFDSYEDLKEMVLFLKTYSSDYNKIRFRAPKYYFLEGLCTDYQQSENSEKLVTNGMVRVINVKSVLEKAEYLGDGQLIIKIQDNQILNNNKVFTVKFKDNRCFEIEEDSDEKPDVEMSINVFSAAITGNYKTSDFPFIDGADVMCSYEKLQKVFYEKPCWINNYF